MYIHTNQIFSLKSLFFRVFFKYLSFLKKTHFPKPKNFLKQM